jgi:hypothetical protein
MLLFQTQPKVHFKSPFYHRRTTTASTAEPSLCFSLHGREILHPSVRHARPWSPLPATLKLTLSAAIPLVSYVLPCLFVFVFAIPFQLYKSFPFSLSFKHLFILKEPIYMSALLSFPHCTWQLVIPSFIFYQQGVYICIIVLH